MKSSTTIAALGLVAAGLYLAARGRGGMSMSVQLSDHFALSEFQSKDGAPFPANVVENLRRLAVECLEPIRSEFGGQRITITFNGGYRSPEQNAVVGGAPGSQHKLGKGADIQIAGIAPAIVQSKIDEMQRDGRIPKGGLGRYDTFTHVDIRGRLARWSG